MKALALLPLLVACGSDPSHFPMRPSSTMPVPMRM